MIILFHLGKYFNFLRLVFSKPEKKSIYIKQILIEMENIGISSIGIITILSTFMGAVVALQTDFNVDTPLAPIYTIGFTTRQSVILEFAPTIIGLILAGKVGSSIASEVGTMRVTEQIDALEIMGINSACYLILPKILASIIINPILIIFSMFLGVLGGWIAAIMGAGFSPADYIYGVQFDFKLFDVYYALIKTVFFAFIISSVSGYHGYYTQGGALEVGHSSTKAVVHSSVIIIIFNLILTQLLLT